MNREIKYFWYHHGMHKKDRESIQKVIENKDFYSFIFYYKIYNALGIEHGEIEYDEDNHGFDVFTPIIYLPDEASIWEGNIIKGRINILSRENFNKITFSESEHG